MITAKVVGGVTVGLAGVSAALIIASKRSLEFVDNIGKTATRTGIATDFIQAFQQGAIEAGSSIEQAQKGLEKFSAVVGDGARGLKTVTDLFGDLGVEIRDANGDVRDNTTLLLEVADGISSLDSAAEKSTALRNLFGRSGMQFAQIFEDGSEGLQNFVTEFKQLGFIISESGIRTAETFNDRVSQIKASLFGLQNQIVVAAAPAFLSLADAVKEFIIEQAAASGGFEKFGKQLAIGFVQGLRAASLAFAELANVLSEITSPQITILNTFIRIKKFLRDPVFANIDLIPKENIIDVKKLERGFDKLEQKLKMALFLLKSLEQKEEKH